MKIRLKMSGLIARYLPADSANGQATVELPDDMSVAGLMSRLGLPEEERFLVIVNDSTVPQDMRASRTLDDGDRVSIVPPLKGG